MSYLPAEPNVEDLGHSAASVPKLGADGRLGTIRRLAASESTLLFGHLQRLDPETRRMRFGSPVNDAFLQRYADFALGTDTLVKGLFVDGELRGIAELRFLTGRSDEAEGAFSIERNFQGRGLGGRLFGRLLTAAKNRGIRRLYLTCLRDNRRMQAIARHYGAELSFVEGDAVAELTGQRPDAASIAQEWAEESEAFVFAMIEWRQQSALMLFEPLRRLAANAGSVFSRL
ncbi:GNAT family N-acetyltransferase [Aurantimonas sp. VKM B-3413]|uniref:GNAT family N-acetyltransferase n=1 Tax=Aurantimonas sp. VKM B-3413 TaxID=2779401 RepID=UPI001E2E8909|nr:GNAT family N-acetyltransferase [Aurantimonas sp. VKM B-3413]MCB8839178.1 GNAT family N-acetyltransferase [Aurantimonas sp. VKM B-3413]